MSKSLATVANEILHFKHLIGAIIQVGGATDLSYLWENNAEIRT